MEITSTDPHDIFLVGWLLGCGFTILLGIIFSGSIGNRKKKYQELTREIKHLTKSDNQVVTLTDLVFKSQYLNIQIV